VQTRVAYQRRANRCSLNLIVRQTGSSTVDVVPVDGTADSRAVPFRYFSGCDDHPGAGSTMPVTPPPDEQPMTSGSHWIKAQRIPMPRKVKTFFWRYLIDSSVSIVGHPYPASDCWEAEPPRSIQAETRRGLREIERHLRAL
jgi:hypothetical protein